MDFERYATASQRLLNYAELNRSDNEFARQRGEIVYLFDTSVLESYWRRDPQSTGGRYGTDDLLTERAAHYSGWLALKYLIEHTLPAQKQSGFVSPAHWNEALERVQKLETDARSDLKVQSSSNRENVEEALKNLTNIEHDPVRLLKEAERRNVGELFTSIMQAVSRGERVRRVFQNGRSSRPSIRDLTSCKYYWGLAGPKVRHQDFRRWHVAIADHRKRLERSRGRNVGLASRNVESDAMTLASIQTMYRGNPESGGDKPSVRFVFVTADAALHDAYLDLQPRLEREGIPFFLRHPHIYAPLLNHRDMSRGSLPGGLSKAQSEALSTVFERVEEALEPLIHNYDLQSPLVQGYDMRLNYTLKLWSRNVETICLANSHYVLSDTLGDYVTATNLARILSAPNVREAAAHAVSEDIIRIRDGHLQVMSLVALDSLQNARNDMKSAASTPDFRAPVKLIGVDIAGELGYSVSVQGGHSVWLDSLLRSFRDSQIDQSPEEVIERLRSSWDDDRLAPAAQLLASCIFFAANAWESARMCAELCNRRIKRKRHRNVWLREAMYCEALAIRMQLRSKEDVLKGKAILTNNIADHGDSLASIRDRVERASLVLTAAIVQCIEDHLHHERQDTQFIDLIARDELRTEVDVAISDFEIALRAIANYEQSKEAATAARIRIQAEVNLLGVYLFVQVLDRPITDEAIEPSALAAARAALVSTLHKNDFDPGFTAQVYLAMSKAVISGTETALQAALEFLVSKAVTGITISRPDDREVRYFKAYLMKRLGGRQVEKFA